MAAKFSRKGYFLPTPRALRVLGDTLLGTFGSFGVLAILDAINEPEASTKKMKMYVAGGSVFLGMVGKFLTNFFKEDDKSKKEEDGSQPGN
jgi:hypothetical protein